jgi:hypothetical protein
LNAATSTLNCAIADAATTCTDTGTNYPVSLGPVNVRGTPASFPTARSATWTAIFTIPSGNPIQ